MKAVYILIVLLVAASALGCVDRNTPDTAVPGQQEPVSPAPGQTSGQTDEFGIESDLEILDMMFNDIAVPGQQDAVSPAPGQTSGQTDEFGIESDLEILDMMFNDTAMDISFEVIDDTFT